MNRRRCGSQVFLLSVTLVCACGCRPAAFVAGAVVRQGASPCAGRGRPGPWAYYGLDPCLPPRIRPGSYATATHDVPFLDTTALGPHSYCFNWSERNGIVYACRAGHIDIAHVRKAADYTGYLAAVTLEHLERGETRFQCRLIEPSLYFVTLTLPPEWNCLDDAEREWTARGVSRELAQYLAYTALTWHEILTWFGYRPRPYKSEFPSAFSWEDTYSNLLGVHVAAAALEDQSVAFGEAVTMVLDERLRDLGGQPAGVAKQAAGMMRGKWYSYRWFSTRIWMRNFDLGLDDGDVSPCLVPSLAVCEGVQPLPLAAPVLNRLADYGVSAKVEIDARVWEQNRILEVLRDTGVPATRRLDPALHFPVLVNYIAKCAAEEEG